MPMINKVKILEGLLRKQQLIINELETKLTEIDTKTDSIDERLKKVEKPTPIGE